MISPPKNEIIWVQYLADNKITYVITSTIMRDMYYLYKVGDNNKLIKTKYKSECPTELEQRIYKNKER